MHSPKGPAEVRPRRPARRNARRAEPLGERGLAARWGAASARRAGLRVALVGLAGVVTLLAGARAARAATAVLLPAVLDGPAAQAEEAKLRLAAERALQAQQYILTPQSDLEIALSGEPQLKDCHTELCRERIGRLLDAQIVARYRIRTQPGAGKKNPDWHINVEIFDGEVGAFAARLTEDCADCGAAKAQEQLGDMLMRAVLQSASQPRGVLEIFTQPAGATVFVDGTELGITPYKRPALVGTRKIVLQHVGYRSEQFEVQVDETRRQRTERTMAAGTDPIKVVVVEKEKTPVYKKWWFWVALGGAAAAAAAITAGIVVGTSAPPSEPTIPANTLKFTF